MSETSTADPWLAWRARAWVLAQFGLIGVFLLWPARWQLTPLALPLGVSALLLGLAALRANPPGHFNIRPLPKAGAHLVREGPYRWIRHPMYSALLLGMAALLAASPSWPHALLGLALALVLRGKAALEEKLLMQCWDDYADYRARSGGFVPRLRR